MAKVKNNTGTQTSMSTCLNNPKSARKAPASTPLENNSAKIASGGVTKKTNKSQAAAKTAATKASIKTAFQNIASQEKLSVSKLVDDTKSDVNSSESSSEKVAASDAVVDAATDLDSEYSGEESDHEWEDVAGENSAEDPSLPKPKRCKWKQHEIPDKNGRVVGRKLVMWHRPRMIEKLILHMQYECQRAHIQIPWEKIVHRLAPGSSGQSACQHLAKIRKTLLREGHLVPPLIGKLGTTHDSSVRGYMRDSPDGPDKEIIWTQDVKDLKVSLHDGKVRGSGMYRQVEVEVKRQAKIELEKLKGGANEYQVKFLRDATYYKHRANGVKVEKVEVEVEDTKTVSSSEQIATASTPTASTTASTPTASTPVSTPTKKHSRRGANETARVASEGSDAEYSPTKRVKANSTTQKSNRSRKPVKVADPELEKEDKQTTVKGIMTPVPELAVAEGLHKVVISEKLASPAKSSKLRISKNWIEPPATPTKKRATGGPRGGKLRQTIFAKTPANVPSKSSHASDPALAHLMTREMQPKSNVIPGDEFSEEPKKVQPYNTNFDDFSLFAGEPDFALSTIAPPHQSMVSGPPNFNFDIFSTPLYGPEERFSNVGLIGDNNDTNPFSPTRFGRTVIPPFMPSQSSSLQPTSSQLSEQTLVPQVMGYAANGFDHNYQGFSQTPSPADDSEERLDLMFMNQ